MRKSYCSLQNIYNSCSLHTILDDSYLSYSLSSTRSPKSMACININMKYNKYVLKKPGYYAYMHSQYL